MHNQEVEQQTFKLADSSPSQSFSLYIYMNIVYTFIYVYMYKSTCMDGYMDILELF